MRLHVRRGRHPRRRHRLARARPGSSRMVPDRADPRRRHTIGARRISPRRRRIDRRCSTCAPALPPQSTAVAVNLTAVAPVGRRIHDRLSRADAADRPPRASTSPPARPDRTTPSSPPTTAPSASTPTRRPTSSSTSPRRSDPTGSASCPSTRCASSTPAARCRSPADESAGLQLTRDAAVAAHTASASVNVTALDQPADGFVTTFDCVTLRETSTLNPGSGPSAPTARSCR